MPRLGLGLGLGAGGAPSDPNPAFVQQVAAAGNAGSGATVVLTLSGVTTTTGNHLIVCAAIRAGALSSVSDSKGNTWQVDENVEVAGAGAGIASCKITTPLVNGDTITVTITGGTGGISASCAEFSGLAASGWADVQASAGNAVAGTAADSGAAATSAVANSLVIGAVGHQSTVTAFTPEVLSPVWNQGTTAVSTSQVQTVRPLYRVVTATGAFATKATWTSSRIWAACVAVYK
jgi:hypothetical protein